MSHYKKILVAFTTLVLKLLPTKVQRLVLKSYHLDKGLQRRTKYHVHPFHYFSPIPDFNEIDTTRLAEKRNLPGFPTDLSVFYTWIDELKPYAAEIHSLPRKPQPGAEFWFHNTIYEDFDAVTWYSTIRHLKPRRIIEIGCGHSSRITTIAARKNQTEGFECECLYIEPYPEPDFLKFELHGSLRVQKIERVPVADFARLQSGDILFVDTSHVLKAQNDLCQILQQILPALADGVYVHFHDIFTPYDYPEEWILKGGLYFNEQYALEAMFCNGLQYEIILPLYALWREHFEKVAELLPVNETRPAAFWIRKKKAV